MCSFFLFNATLQWYSQGIHMAFMSVFAFYMIIIKNQQKGVKTCWKVLRMKPSEDHEEDVKSRSWIGRKERKVMAPWDLGHHWQHPSRQGWSKLLQCTLIKIWWSSTNKWLLFSNVCCYLWKASLVAKSILSTAKS